MIEILLVEDQHLLREGLKLILQADPEILVVSEAQTAFAALELLVQRSFDAVVLDLSLPDQDGLECILEVRGRGCQVPILVVTMHQSPQVVERAQSLGANGYVLKSASPQELRQALRCVAQGGTYIQSVLTRPAQAADLPQLSRNERHLLSLAHRGVEQCALAGPLGLSPTTVESLLRSLCRKLDVSGLEQALEQAVNLGLVLNEPHR